MNGKIRVLIADDHAIVRGSLNAILQTQPDIEVIGEATDGIEAVERALELAPDVVLMDIRMPLMDGLVATSRIKRENDKIQVLALTAYDDGDNLFHLLQAGGSGYVLKAASTDELMRAIRAAHRGDVFLYPSAAKALVTDYLQRSENGMETHLQDNLTVREREVLKLVADGYTSGEIAVLLHRSVKTIQAHRSNLMGKLKLHDRVELVRYAIRKGLIEP